MRPQTEKGPLPETGERASLKRAECDESLEKHTYPGPPCKSYGATTRDMWDAIHSASVASMPLLVKQNPLVGRTAHSGGRPEWRPRVSINALVLPEQLGHPARSRCDPGLL
jgi:hypothetical protein